MKIFISYNSRVTEVADFAKKLESKLKEHDHVVVFIFENPEENPAGALWYNILAEKIRDCDAFIAIITQGYLDSDMCYEEFFSANVTNKKLIIPIVFEDPNLKPDYKKGKLGAGIQMGTGPRNWVKFKTADVEESASDGEKSPYEQILIGLQQVPVVLPTERVEETDNGDHLEISQLNDIITTLEKCYVSSAVWNDLCLKLGLYFPTLQTIDKKFKGDPTECLKEGLHYWLEKKDGVMAKGGPTWTSLVNALTPINKAAADKIKKMKCK